MMRYMTGLVMALTLVVSAGVHAYQDNACDAIVDDYLMDVFNVDTLEQLDIIMDELSEDDIDALFESSGLYDELDACIEDMEMFAGSNDAPLILDGVHDPAQLVRSSDQFLL